jgi:hypothetical protein
MKKHLLLLLFVFITTFAFTQSRITGVVVDETGSPLPGVNVVEQIERPAIPNGTITNLDGKFILISKQPKGKLIFSYVGLKAESRLFNGDEDISVILKSSGADLEEALLQPFQL